MHISFAVRINSTSAIQNSTIWILGDFNMPHFDWHNEYIKSSCKLQTMYDDFLENLANFSREQIVNLR